MAKHRSLSNALLTPEKLAFIKGGTATDTNDSEKSTAGLSKIAEDLRSSEIEIAPPKKSDTPQPPTIQFGPPTTSTSATDPYLVAVTTRLKSRTADALRRAYLEQKLQRREPATQQEIIEEAVQHWLRQHAYLD